MACSSAKTSAKLLRAGLAAAFLCGAWPAAVSADQSDPRLPGLFERLARGDMTAPQAGALEDEIWRIWGDSGSATVDLLMQRGQHMLAAQDADAAISIFGDVIALAPDYAEAWNKRATAYYLKNDYQRSLRDVKRTLALEPRHFGALSGLGMILEQLGDETSALRAYQMTLKLNPHLANIAGKVRLMEPAVNGQRI